MAVNVLNLDCVDHRSNQPYRFDVSNPETFGDVFSVRLPEGMRGHTLIEGFGIHRGGVSPDTSIENEVLTVSFFLATSGRYNLADGSGPTWNLQEQQLDFLISYLEQLLSLIHI